MAGPFSKYQGVADGFNVDELGGRPNGRPVGVLNGQGQAPNQFSNPALGGLNRSQFGVQPVQGMGDGMVPGINPPWERGLNPVTGTPPVEQTATMVPGISPVTGPSPITPPWLKTASATDYRGMDQAAREAYNTQMNQQKTLVANRPELTGVEYKALGTPERQGYNQEMTLKNNMALQEQRRKERAAAAAPAAPAVPLTPLQQRQAAMAETEAAPGQGRDRFAARQAADRAARQTNRATARNKTWGGQLR